jgi:hypothetical protein
MTRPVAFSEDGARRVIAATKAYEGGNRDASPIKFRHVGDEGGSVRVGKTTSAWNKGTVATIDLSMTEGSGITLPNCENKFANVGSGKWVAVALGVNGTWYLISAEC